MCSRFYQWYQRHTNFVQGSTNGTIGFTIGTNSNANGTIGTNGNANGTIGTPNGTIGKPMVPLATNGTVSKITNGTIGRTPNRALIALYCLEGIPALLGSPHICQKAIGVRKESQVCQLHTHCRFGISSVY